MRVVFWGTPEFATVPLRALIGEGHDVVAVVTQPDRPVGRHHSTTVASEVKQVAQEEGIHVLQPESSRTPQLLEELRGIAPDISVVVAFGQILPQEIIDVPVHGTINIHASLLPQLRGAAPIQAAIRDGLETSGVTVMQMVRKLDAGPIILQNETPILADETYGELQMRLSELGALSLIEAMALIGLDKAQRQEQDEQLATYAPRITREDARIDWTGTATVVARLIRAFDPRPGAFTTRRAGRAGGGSAPGADSVAVQMYGARVLDSERGDPGEILDIDESGLLVACGTGSVRVAYVHPSGRRRMPALEWRQGRGVEVGDILGTSA